MDECGCVKQAPGNIVAPKPQRRDAEDAEERREKAVEIEIPLESLPASTRLL